MDKAIKFFMQQNTVLHNIGVVVKEDKLFCYVGKTKTTESTIWTVHWAILCAIL